MIFSSIIRFISIMSRQTPSWRLKYETEMWHINTESHINTHGGMYFTGRNKRCFHSQSINLNTHMYDVSSYDAPECKGQINILNTQWPIKLDICSSPTKSSEIIYTTTSCGSPAFSNPPWKPLKTVFNSKLNTFSFLLHDHGVVADWRCKVLKTGLKLQAFEYHSVLSPCTLWMRRFAKTMR